MMKMDEIVEVIKGLVKSQGSYGRLYNELMSLKEHDPAMYEKITYDWEKEGFETTLDLILYLEEGKYCKRKYWKIPWDGTTTDGGNKNVRIIH